MKKVLLALVLCISLCACSQKDEEGFITVDVQEILTKISNKDTFLIVINNYESSDSCYTCSEFEKELQVLIDQKINIYTFNSFDVGEVDIDQLNIALGDYTSWPTAFYVVEGEIPLSNKYEYSLNPEGWQTWLENMKILND